MMSLLKKKEIWSPKSREKFLSLVVNSQKTKKTFVLQQYMSFGLKDEKQIKFYKGIFMIIISDWWGESIGLFPMIHNDISADSKQ